MKVRGPWLVRTSAAPAQGPECTHSKLPVGRATPSSRFAVSHFPVTSFSRVPEIGLPVDVCP